MSTARAKLFLSDYPHVYMSELDQAYLQTILEFAGTLPTGPTDFLQAWEWGTFASFFGHPCKTRVSKDFADRSLYFEVYVADKLAMNGGIIWHPSTGTWSVHT